MANNADAHITVTADTLSAISKIQALTNTINDLNSKLGGLKSANLSSFAQELQSVTKIMNELSKAKDNIRDLDSLLSTSGSSGLNSTKQQLLAVQQLGEATVKNAEKQKAAITSMAKLREEVRIGVMQEIELEKIRGQHLDNNIKRFEQQMVAQRGLYNSLNNREENLRGGFAQRVLNSGAYISGYAGFAAATSGIKAGLAAIRDYELGVVDLRRTLDNAGEPALRNFGSAAIKNAKDFGVTIKETQDAMTELARAGVGEKDLIGASKNVLMGLNTTELRSAEEVVSALVSTTKQLKMDISDSGMILDSWNYLADNYAVHTDDFAHAIERSGSASKMLGMDLYDLNAVVTILGENTQASGEQVGTAFKSLSARLLREGTVEKLEEFGIKVKKNNDEFLDFRSIMMNINDVIKDLPENSTKLSDIMDTLGGAWRKNWITALVKDFDRFDRLVEEQANQVGYSAKENEKAMDTVEKKLQRLKQTFLEAFIDIGKDGNFTQGLKDNLDTITKALEKTINSPTIRKFAAFMGGNPLEALGVTGGWVLFSKMSSFGNPLQTTFSLLNSRFDGKGTFGGLISGLSSHFGFEGKQNRASKLYDDLQKTFKLTDTEMIPLAEKIDNIYNSNTRGIANHRSELERLNAQLQDSRERLIHLKDVDAVKKYRESDALQNFSIRERENLYKQDFKAEMANHKALTQEIKNREAAMIRYNEQADKSGAIMGKMSSALSKQRLIGFASGLVGIGAQMVAIAAIAKTLDYALNHDKNVDNNYRNAVQKYEETEHRIKQQQELVKTFESNIQQKGALYGANGKNLGLSAQDFSQVKNEIEQLKGISPEVDAAIERSAQRLGNYSGAAKAAADALKELRIQEAQSFLSDNEKEINEKIKKSSRILKNQKKIFEDENLGGNGIGYYSDVNGAKRNRKAKDFLRSLGIDDINDSKYVLNDLEKYTDNQYKIKEELLKIGFSEKEIDEYSKNIRDRKEAVRNFSEHGKELIPVKFQGAFSKENRDKIEQFGINIESLANKLKNIGSTAYDENSLIAINEFAEKLATSGMNTIKKFNDFAFQDMSKETGRSFKKSLNDEMQSLLEDGVVDEDSKNLVREGLFTDLFGITEETYNRDVENFNNRIKENKIDVKKAFGIEDAEDIVAKDFSGLTGFINDLSYALEHGSDSAEKIREAMNDGVFKDFDFSSDFIGGLKNAFALDSSQIDGVLSSFQQIKDGGQELIDSFGGQESLFNRLVNFEISEGDIKSKFETLFSGLNIADGMKSQIVSSLNDALHLGLSESEIEEIEVKLGIKADTSGAQEAGAEAGAEASQSAQDAVDSNKPKVSVEAQEGAGAQVGEQVKSEVQTSLSDIQIDTSSVINQLANLDSAEYFKGEKEIKIKFNIDDSASSTVNSFVTSVESKISGLEEKVSGTLGKINQFSSSASVAQSSLNSSLSIINKANTAIDGLRKNMAQPMNLKISTAGLNSLKQIPSITNSVSSGLQRIVSKINQTASAFQAGCNRMVAAWASMTFPPPYIPTPHISVAVGLGTYDVNIAWFAQGGIVPASNGGRIVGVAEAGEDEAIIPISKLKDYIKTSMSDVLEDAMSDIGDVVTKAYKDLAINYNTVTSNGYFSTKVEMPYLEISNESKKAIDSFVHKEIDFSGFDTKNISGVIGQITSLTKYIESDISSLESRIKLYDSMGDKAEKARLEAEKYNLELKRGVQLRQDSIVLARELNKLQERENINFREYLDENLELNYSYYVKISSFGEGENKEKERIENAVKAAQTLVKEVKKANDELMKNNADMAKQMTDRASSLIKKRIEEQYDAQKEEFTRRREMIEREKKQYEKEIKEQTKKLDKAKKEFDNEMARKTKVLDDQIDKLKDDRKAKQDAEKLDKLNKELKEAEDKLKGVEMTYNTKVYSMDENGNWQFTYEANPEDLEKAQDKLKDAQDKLTEYMEDKEIERLQKQKESLNDEKKQYADHYSDLKEKLAEQQEMKKESYDEEINILKSHITEIDGLKKKALDQLPSLTKQFVNSILANFGYDRVRAFDYLGIAQGDYGGEAYNPLSQIFKNKYVQELEKSGMNIEKYTNKLLEIIHNPEKHAPHKVMEAYEEIKKLGTTGAIDTSGYQFSKEFMSEVARQGFASANEFLNAQLNRIGQRRYIDSGTGDANRGKDMIVTAEHMADWFQKLGLPVSAIQLSNLASNVVRSEIAGDGTLLNSIVDRMMNYGSDYAFDKDKQGLLLEPYLNNIDNTIKSFDGTSKMLYDYTGALRTKDAQELAIAGNVVYHQINQKEMLKDFATKANSHNEEVSEQLTTIVGKMDANQYFSTKGTRNEHLRYAMGNNTDANEFIINQLSRIGTVRTSGEKTGQIVTKEEIYEYLHKLGISDKLIANTMNISDSNERMIDKLGLNGELTGANTTALKSLYLESQALVGSLGINNKSQINLSKNLEGLPLAIQRAIMSSSPSGNHSGGSSGGDTAPINPSNPNQNNGGESSGENNNSSSQLSSIIEEGKALQASLADFEPLKYALENIVGANGDLFTLVKISAARTDKPKDVIDNWLNLDLHISRDYIKKVRDYYGYSKGGIIDYTGMAQLHGSPNAPEVVFNATDAKKLYDIVHELDIASLNMPSLTSVSLENGFPSIDIKDSGNTMTIENIELNFPNATDGEDVKNAILDLPKELQLYYDK